MTEISVYLISIGKLIQKLSKRLRKAKAPIATVLTASSISATIAILAWHQFDRRSPKERDIGGLDLGPYCEGLGFKALELADSEIHCRAPIDLLSACQREYPIATQTSSQEGSGRCSDKAGKDLGGVSDMLGYCRDANNKRWAERMETSSDGGWWCRLPVDATAACIGQYNDLTATARWTKNTWRCLTHREADE